MGVRVRRKAQGAVLHRSSFYANLLLASPCFASVTFWPAASHELPAACSPHAFIYLPAAPPPPSYPTRTLTALIRPSTRVLTEEEKEHSQQLVVMEEELSQRFKLLAKCKLMDSGLKQQVNQLRQGRKVCML